MKDNIKKAKLLLTSTLILSSSMTITHGVFAHGSITSPPSRVYSCFKEGPENPQSAACRALVRASGTQGLYDWNGVNQLPNGNHRAFVPDGKLCSAGKASHAGLDLPRNDWRATNIAPNQNGMMDFVYRATAPHSTNYHKFYITKDGYNPNRPLNWSDLESQPFCDLPEVPLENGEYRMNCPFPSGKSGKHVIYHIWQRDDSPEAFYACVDVNLSGDMVPTDWVLLGNLRAAQDLPVNTKVTLRLFDSAGQDVESFSVTLGDGMNSANAWPFHLAEEVNATSTLVNVGVLNGNQIRPVRSAQRNNVYVSSTESYRFAVDIDQPEPMPGPSPTPNPTPNPGPGPDGGPGGNDCPTDPNGGPNGGPNGDNDNGGHVDYIYPKKRRSYTAGTIVRGRDGNRYECKPFPYSGWCGQAPRYYSPGKGLAWKQAWIRLRN